MTAATGTQNGHLLAIDVRPQRIGYVAFESSAHLLDSGTRKMKSPVLATARIESLINAFNPSIIVLLRIAPTSPRHRPRTTMLQRMICRLARRSQLDVAFVSEHALRDHFLACGPTTKHEVAMLLAKRFPDLAWKLHEKRKIYDREAWIMAAFDAAALGIAYLEMNEAVSDEMQTAH